MKIKTKGFIQHHFLGAKSGAGFTIIELLVVIAIIGLLSSVVLVSMKGSTGKAKIAKGLEFSQTLMNVIGADAVGIWTFDEGSGGTAHDKSGYGNHGTLVGNTHFVSGEENTPHWYVNKGEGRSALSFDGSGDYVQCPIDLRGVENFTIAGWWHPVEYFSAGSYSGGIIRSSAPDSYKFHLGQEWGGVVFYVRGNDGSLNSVSAGSFKAVQNSWHYLVGVLDGDTMSIYLDGKLKNEFSDASVPTTINSTSISMGHGGSRYFHGLLDEVRIYERALGSSEIQQHYADGAEKHGATIALR